MRRKRIKMITMTISAILIGSGLILATILLEDPIKEMTSWAAQGALIMTVIISDMVCFYFSLCLIEIALTEKTTKKKRNHRR